LIIAFFLFWIFVLFVKEDHLTYLRPTQRTCGPTQRARGPTQRT
jgi:hypothetical protein